MTIRLKLFLSFLAVSLLPLMFLGWQFYGATYRAFSDTIRARLASLAVVQRDRLLSNYISGTFTDERVTRVATGYYDFLGETGETLVVGKDEHGAAVLELPRRFSDAPLSGNMGTLLGSKTDTFTEDLVDGRGKHTVAASAYFKERDWSVIVKIDRDEVYGPFYALFGGVLLLSLIFVVLGVAFLSLLVTESFLTPIRDLTEVTRAISMGNMRATIDPDTLSKQDEIGDLGRAFDRTVISLKLAMSDLDAEAKLHANDKKNALAEQAPTKENPVG